MKISIFLALLTGSACAFAAGLTSDEGPLRLVHSTPLPYVTGGDFDHFAVDEAGNRLYVVSEVYGSIEVFDLHSGASVRSVTGKVKSPRKIFFLPDKHALFVADAAAACIRVFDTASFDQTGQVSLEAGPDAGAYDPATRMLYVGNGGKAAHQDYSFVSAISVDSLAVAYRIQIPAATLKTVLLDPMQKKLYVTMRDKNQIGVISLADKKLETIWTNPSLHTDSAAAIDLVHHLIFAGNRKPGQLLVLNQSNGNTVASLPIGETSDDMTYDADHQRLFVASADGVDLVAQDSPNRYRSIQHLDTFGGKTAVYVPSLHRYFVVHTKSEKAPEAALQVFSVE